MDTEQTAGREECPIAAEQSERRPVLRGSGRDRRMLWRNIPEPDARGGHSRRTIAPAAVRSGSACYPGSMPVMQALIKNGAIAALMSAGASIRSCFCGPCFGAGDVPANGAFSIRHSTRNFPNREGSKPADGQVVLCGPNGCPLHCGHRPQRRRAHRRHGTGLRPRRYS